MERDERRGMPLRGVRKQNYFGRRWRRFGSSITNFRPCPWIKRDRKKPGPVEALRSDDSIIPLSTQPIDSATSDELQTIVTTKSSAISVANSKTMHNNASNQKQKRRSSLLCGLGSSRDDTEDSDNSVPETAPLPGQLTGQVLSDEPIPTPFSDWMANLPLHRHQLPFNQISIPGSHDSCTATLDRDGGLHPDAPELYRDVLRAFGSWAKTVAHRWSQTQDRTFAEQLNLGIRYFDLRISVRHGFEELYLVHGFYGDSVNTCLTSIRTWLDSHPKEIVLLDMNHFHGLEDQDHQTLVNDIQETFGDKLVPSMDDARHLTLAQMWKNRQQVIVFYHHVNSGISTPNSLQPYVNFLWPGSMIPSPWPRTTKIKDLIDFLDKSTSCHAQHSGSNNNSNHQQPPSCPSSPTSSSSPSSSTQPRNSFFVSQGVLTPTVYTVVGHVTSSLKDHFARPASQAIVEWLKRHKKSKTTTTPVGIDGDSHITSNNGTVESSNGKQKQNGAADGINIVIVDFIDLDPSYVETVVKLNYADEDEFNITSSEENENLKQLAPVIQIIQQSDSSSRQQRDVEVAAVAPHPTTTTTSKTTIAVYATEDRSSSFLADESLTRKVLGVESSSTALSSRALGEEEDASTALSSRSLTPTPLQFIDATSGNSPAVTPIRLGLAASTTTAPATAPTTAATEKSH